MASAAGNKLFEPSPFMSFSPTRDWLKLLYYGVIGVSIPPS